MYTIKMFQNNKWVKLGKYKSFTTGQRYLEKYRQQDKSTSQLYGCTPRMFRLEDFEGNLAEHVEQLDLFSFV